jgi:hypothetical protein
MDRRSQYRVALEEADGLQTVLLERDGWMVCGRLIDLSADGAGVRVTRFPATVPAAGQRVDLRFPCALFNEPLTVPAAVMHRTAAPGALHLGVRFADRPALDQRLWPAIHRVFNRRRAPRLAARQGVGIRLAAEGSAADVTPLDVSEIGLGVCVPMDVEWAHKDTQQVALSLTLPGRRHLFNLSGSIRTRRLEPGARIRYGVALDLDESDPRRRALADYVARPDETMSAAA